MITISKVAEHAGVSRTTVSHVLNHADRVSAHLRVRVLKAVEELGYVPNPQAKSLRTGRTNVVAMLIPDIRNPFYPELVRTVQTELEGGGRDTLIFNADVPGGHSQEHSREYLRQIRGKRVDGLIISDFALHGMYDAIHHIDIPTVFIGHLPNHAVDSVEADVVEGCRQMGLYLASKGHRRVAHVTGPSFFEEAMMRAAGFESGLAEGGAPPVPELRFEGSYLPPSGKEAVDLLFGERRVRAPTAIFFANYLMAMGGLAALHDIGLRIPEDVAVAVFGDQPQMEYIRPRLTRVGVAPTLLGATASQMLMDRLEGRYSGPPRSHVIACRLNPEHSA
jgi:DNA-binding LacI/PurR family transcriptional regulator